MKKIITLATLMIVMALSSMCSAANWYWLASNDEHSIFIDTSSAYRDGHWLCAWYKWTSTDGSYQLVEEKSTIYNRRIYYKMGNLCAYNANRHLEFSHNYNFQHVDELPPNSIGEVAFVKAMYMYKDK